MAVALAVVAAVAVMGKRFLFRYFDAVDVWFMS